MRKRSVFVLLGLLLVGVSIALWFTRKREESSGSGATAVLPAASVASVTRGSIASDLKVAGQFTPYQEVDLHAKVSGYIRRINVDIGDRVHTGQILATLEVPELNAQVAGAQAEVRHSESEILRGQSEVARAQSNHAALHAAYTRLDEAAKQRPGLIAEQELDDARAKDQEAEAQINVAKAAVEASREQLGVSEADKQRVQTMSDYSVVTAPFSGVITQRYADTGSLIQAGTTSNTQAMPVVRLAQSDLLRLRMPVPEDDVRFVQDGGVVEVKVQGALDASTRTMLAEVDVPNTDLSLSPGMYAETQITLQRRADVLSVPAQAIVQDGDQAYVLTVNGGGTVEKKGVRLGIQSQDRTEVSGDLREGDSVIVSGKTNYEPGERVRPQRSSASASTKGGTQ